MTQILPIIAGPSNESLRLSLTDVEVGDRYVTFKYGHEPLDLLRFRIVAMERLDRSATKWRLRCSSEVGVQYAATYDANSRKGSLERLPAKPCASLDARKSDALMEAIDRVFHIYREHHSGDLCEEMFRVLLQARAIYRATEEQNGMFVSLDEAIADMKRNRT